MALYFFVVPKGRSISFYFSHQVYRRRVLTGSVQVLHANVFKNAQIALMFCSFCERKGRFALIFLVRCVAGVYWTGYVQVNCANVIRHKLLSYLDFAIGKVISLLFFSSAESQVCADDGLCSGSSCSFSKAQIAAPLICSQVKDSCVHSLVLVILCSHSEVLS